MSGFTNLPGELFAEVAKHYVNIVGIRVAYENRGVNHKFADAILYEITYTQPVGAFRKAGTPRSIFPESVERRVATNNLHGFSATAVEFLRRLADVINRNGGITGLKAGETVLQKVCEEVFANSNVIVPFCTKTTTPGQIRNYSTKDGHDEALVVAIALEDRTLIQALIKSGASLTSETHLFGYTLEWAASHCGLDIFKWLMGLIVLRTVRRKRRNQQLKIRNQARRILEEGKETHASELLKFYVRPLGNPSTTLAISTEFAIDTFATALDCNAVDFIKTILDNVDVNSVAWGFRQRFLGRDNYPADLEAIMLDLIDSDVFESSHFKDPQPTVNIPVRGRNNMSQSLLDIAVNHGETYLVQQLLGSGASADGVMLWNSTYSFPLERAIKLNHYEIVKLLLDHDAQRSMSWTYPNNAEEFVVEVTGGQGAVHDIMVRALEKEERNRWAWPLRR